MTMPTVKELENEYIRTHAKSQQLYQQALMHFASGVTHDARFAKPFPIYATHTSGSRKWDVDGNEYVDYVMGHGTLILGYGDARVLAAFQEQIPKAIHMGTSSELEIEWAELLKQLVPAAQNGWIDDERATPRVDRHEPLHRQAFQSLAKRAPADLESAGELRLDEMRARRELSRKDGRLDQILRSCRKRR